MSLVPIDVILNNSMHNNKNKDIDDGDRSNNIISQGIEDLLENEDDDEDQHHHQADNQRSQQMAETEREQNVLFVTKSTSYLTMSCPTDQLLENEEDVDMEVGTSGSFLERVVEEECACPNINKLQDCSRIIALQEYKDRDEHIYEMGEGEIKYDSSNSTESFGGFSIRPKQERIVDGGGVSSENQRCHSLTQPQDQLQKQQRDDEDVSHERETSADKGGHDECDDDDDSIYQGLSLDLNEPWERSLLRSVINSDNSNNNNNSNFATSRRDPSMTMTTTSAIIGSGNKMASSPTSFSPKYPSSKKVFLAHTESRDYAYDATGDDELLSLDTSNSDLIFSSASRFQNHLQRQYIHRTMMRDPSWNNHSNYNNCNSSNNDENLDEDDDANNADHDDDHNSHDTERRRHHDHRHNNLARVYDDYRSSSLGNLVSFVASDQSQLLMQGNPDIFSNGSSGGTNNVDQGNYLLNRGGGYRQNNNNVQYQLPMNVQVQPSSSSLVDDTSLDYVSPVPSSSFSSYEPLRQAGAFDEDNTSTCMEYATSDYLISGEQ